MSLALFICKQYCIMYAYYVRSSLPPPSLVNARARDLYCQNAGWLCPRPSLTRRGLRECLPKLKRFDAAAAECSCARYLCRHISRNHCLKGCLACRRVYYLLSASRPRISKGVFWYLTYMMVNAWLRSAYGWEFLGANSKK